MTSLVLQLQQKALDTNCSVSDVVRHAFVIAKKLDQCENTQWLQYELEGYPVGYSIPKYRQIPTFLAAQNSNGTWTHVPILDPVIEKMMCFYNCVLPIHEIIEGLKLPPEQLAITVSASLRRFLNERSKPKGETSFIRPYSRGHLNGILETVRNKILCWSLDLEKQTLKGECQMFSSVEKDNAPNLIIDNYAGAVSIGNENTSNVSQNQINLGVIPDNLESLIAALMQNDIPQNRIDELKEILNDSRVDSNTFTDFITSIKNWLSALSGTVMPFAKASISKYLGIDIDI
ncbi:MAG: hypothetical protein LBU65_01010 [Planctomycetaceae bacterium]|nr:hypothetical protein [Planctomycetaceae bacterium]